MMLKKVSAVLITASLLGAPAMAATVSGDAPGAKSATKANAQEQLAAKKKTKKSKKDAKKIAAVSVMSVKAV